MISVDNRLWEVVYNLQLAIYKKHEYTYEEAVKFAKIDADKFIAREDYNEDIEQKPSTE